jgi:YidC/Oxa1 family membrane protein insertase
MKINKRTILTFVVVFLAVQFIFSFFGKGQSAETVKTGNFIATTTKTEYGLHDVIEVKIKNDTETAAVIKSKCPSEPLNAYTLLNNEWTQKTTTAEIKCENVKDTEIASGQEILISYSSWNNAIFGELGRYKIKAQIIVTDGTPTGTALEIESNEFEIKPQGFFGIIWNTALYQPIYNILILLIGFMPFHDLGMAIILLTIIIRTLLLVPSHKALKSQRKLQEIQPHLTHLREKHKDNQEMLAKETMAIWKEHKVNPFGSCLPLLIQFPILIALFYVIQTGLNPDNAYLLYEPLKGFSVSNINVMFMGFLDLTKVNAFALPLFVGAMQFLQMKLAMAKSEKNKAKDTKPKKNETEIMNNMMLYIMPVMIAVFTASVPAGVGLYWSVSTMYGIVQQLVVNKQVGGEKAKVRVINQ